MLDMLHDCEVYSASSGDQPPPGYKKAEAEEASW